MGSQPGVMLYFDVRPCLSRLNDCEKGQLFEAILDYSEHGIVPDFDDKLGVAWDFLKPRLDRDSERYAEKTLKSAYAAFVRELKKHDRPAITFEQRTAMSDIERCQMITPDTV